jgi:hypothetical protein
VTLPFDPTVASVLDRFAPPAEVDVDELLAHVHERRRARRWRAVLVAAVAAVVLTGAAFAARELDLLPWLEAKNATTAIFTVDSSRTYHGPVPAAVRCPGASGKRFECSPTPFDPAEPRIYLFEGRVHAYEEVTRESVLEDIATAKRERTLPPGRADQMRRDALAAGDDFFERENVLETMRQTGHTIQDPRRPDRIYVPPDGLPALVACTGAADGRRLACGDLREMEGVPAGSPIYALTFGADWIQVPLQSDVRDREGVLKAVFGRELTPAEARLLSSLSLLVETH